MRLFSWWRGSETQKDPDVETVSTLKEALHEVSDSQNRVADMLSEFTKVVREANANRTGPSGNPIEDMIRGRYKTNPRTKSSGGHA